VSGGNGRLSNFLADTWWFGLTRRLAEADFKKLAQLRVRQGFTTVQIVVGIPPEVGPENENASSEAGFPWTLEGTFNEAYLQLARERIQFLNESGMSVIVYGAWGQQIEWLGRERMAEWWLRLINTLDSLNVTYCLTGESNLWLGGAAALLPDKSTDDLIGVTSTFSKMVEKLPPQIRYRLIAVASRVRNLLNRPHLKMRRQDWGFVLETIVPHTNHPIIIHPTRGEPSDKAVTNADLLAAHTAQTGHDYGVRKELWQLPLKLLKTGSTKPYINLEPWYEGILNQFGAEDQLFAYWVSMLAGAASHCYGAHGIWNVGDGRFLAHWGQQTFEQATVLDTPRLLGLSHEQYRQWDVSDGQTFYETSRGQLTVIGRQTQDKTVRFFPDVALATQSLTGKIWRPLEGCYADEPPNSGPVVVFQTKRRVLV
jgi:hypothetical protein